MLQAKCITCPTIRTYANKRNLEKFRNKSCRSCALSISRGGTGDVKNAKAIYYKTLCLSCDEERIYTNKRTSERCKNKPCFKCSNRIKAANLLGRTVHPVDENGKKQCKRCEENKDLKEFKLLSHTGRYNIYCIPCTRLFRKEQHKESYLYKTYGLTKEAYLCLLEHQDYSCAICKRSDLKLNVDHDHITGKVRGLLCSNCNTAIGLLFENLLIINSCKEYLTLHNIDNLPTFDKSTEVL